jgi:hypothetical protein
MCILCSIDSGDHHGSYANKPNAAAVCLRVRNQYIIHESDGPNRESSLLAKSGERASHAIHWARRRIQIFTTRCFGGIESISIITIFFGSGLFSVSLPVVRLCGCGCEFPQRDLLERRGRKRAMRIISHIHTQCHLSWERFECHNRHRTNAFVPPSSEQLHVIWIRGINQSGIKGDYLELLSTF